MPKGVSGDSERSWRGIPCRDWRQAERGHRHDVRAPDYDDWSTPSELVMRV